MRRYHQSLSDIFGKIEGEYATGAARLRAFVDQFRIALRGGESLCLYVAFSASRASLPAEVISEIALLRRMVVEWLGHAFALDRQDGTIGRVQSPALEAAATLALVEGAQFAARADVDAARFESALELLMRRLWRHAGRAMTQSP